MVTGRPRTCLEPVPGGARCEMRAEKDKGPRAGPFALPLVPGWRWDTHPRVPVAREAEITWAALRRQPLLTGIGTSFALAVDSIETVNQAPQID